MTDSVGALSQIIEAKPLPLEVDGVTLYVRHPTTEEYDDAMMLQEVVRRSTLAIPEIKELAHVAATEEMEAAKAAIAELEERLRTETSDTAVEEITDRISYLKRVRNRTLAEELAQQRALTARDRYLVARLLCDDQMTQLFDTNAKTFTEDWERLPLKVKEMARPLVWAVLRMIQDIPFSLEMLRRPKSG